MKNAKNSSNLIDETILDLFKKRKNYSFYEMTKILKISGSSKAKLKVLLDKMVSVGTIYYDDRDKVYTLFENSHLKKGILCANDNNKYYIINCKEKIMLYREFRFVLGSQKIPKIRPPNSDNKKED